MFQSLLKRFGFDDVCLFNFVHHQEITNEETHLNAASLSMLLSHLLSTCEMIQILFSPDKNIENEFSCCINTSGSRYLYSYSNLQTIFMFHYLD